MQKKAGCAAACRIVLRISQFDIACLDVETIIILIHEQLLPVRLATREFCDYVREYFT
jgi:hypothetical protein